MSDDAYRDEQWAQRYAPHVAPINHLVDELGSQVDTGPPPYIAPTYRGVHAPALAVLRDPGPKAGGTRGSGFLSVENDDQTAERQCAFFAEAGLDPSMSCRGTPIPGTSTTHRPRPSSPPAPSRCGG